MDIIVLAGGLSTERDVSFKTGSMVASALRENGHRVILLDVFMGYSDKEENLDEIFERSEEISVKTEDIPETAPDLAAVKASRKDQSPCFFGPNVIRMCQMADIVFMALHGENGENGKIQAAFDLFGIRYTGSDYLSSAIAMDKGMAKQAGCYRHKPIYDTFHKCFILCHDELCREVFQLPVQSLPKDRQDRQDTKED